MNRPALPLAIAALALGPAPLAAETMEASMAVSLTVLPSCAIEVEPMAFGALAAESGEIRAQAGVRLACTPGTPYAVSIDDGIHGGRRMAARQGAGFVAYEVYQDAAATRRWGGGADQALAGVAGTGMIVLTAHGRLLSPAAAGSYGDVLTVTVQF